MLLSRNAKPLTRSLFVAEVHHLGAAIMAVAANGDVGERPVAVDLPDETSQMTAYLVASWPGRSSTATGREVAVS